MICNFWNDLSELRKILFLILFFKKDWFAFRYPMNIFFTKSIEEKYLTELWEKYNNENWGLQLYIHSIYCDTRCNYCDCEALLKWTEENSKNYKNYICNNIKKYWEILNKPLTSLYFWWGTFNLWSDNDIIDICSLVKENFNFAKGYSWQVEIHPYYLTEKTLQILKDFWVTDIMLAVQTTSNKVNKLNNRRFDIIKLEKAIENIIELWFKKVSFDLMYNLPYMTNDDLVTDMNYIYSTWKKLKQNDIDINVEINRWDISLKTWFANIFLKKWWKEKFLDICKYYVNSSKKWTKIVNSYIDNKFLWLFDTQREEIEERKYKNTAILWIWLTSTSYIPGVIAYEDINYSWWNKGKVNYKWYMLSEIDNDLSFISDNLRRGINKVRMEETIKKNEKLKSFYEYYKNSFKQTEDDYYIDTWVDLENDLYNIYMIDENILKNRAEFLLKKWEKLWFTEEDLDQYTDLFLNYYYDRNKLYW